MMDKILEHEGYHGTVEADMEECVLHGKVLQYRDILRAPVFCPCHQNRPCGLQRA